MRLALAVPRVAGYLRAMIQLSFLLEPGAAPSQVAAPLAMTPRADGTRLTGVWPHDDLGAALRQVGVALRELPDEATLTCLFTGRARPLSQWRSAWSSPPTVASTFEARHAIVEGRLFARLFGSYQLGESDVVLVAEATSDVTEVYELLTGWARYRLKRGREAPRWDRPFPYGFSLLGFAEYDVGDAAFWALTREALQSQHLREAFDDRMGSPSPRLFIESEDPKDPDAAYAIGVTRALALRARQRQTLTRLASFYEGAPFAGDLARASATSLVPNAQDAALACDRCVDGRADAFAYREEGQGPLDSGWRFGCLDPDHVHDEAALRILPLGQAVSATPGFLDYLGLPPGWAVTLEAGQRYTTPPGEQRAFLDEEAAP